MATSRIPRAFSGITAGLLVALLAGFARSAEPERTLRILARTPLPAASTVASDVRWASADSVYVVHAHDGVFEIGLDGARKRMLVPALGRHRSLMRPST